MLNAYRELKASGLVDAYVADDTDAIRDQYESQGNPYYATARLWDDGILDPVDTRKVIGMGIAAAVSEQALPALLASSAGLLFVVLGATRHKEVAAH